jgi:putative CocE/NonD family hydrolase
MAYSAPEVLTPIDGVSVARDVLVRMRDGIQLAADIYHPTIRGRVVDEPLPVLLERTPYNKLGVNRGDFSKADPQPWSKPQIASAFAKSGYVVVVQDCRGRYRSEGEFTKYLNEAADGYDTLEWLVAQAWCNGRIGTYGLSYCAHVQAAMACLNPPGLAAMFLDSGGFSSAFHSGIRQGGAFELKQVTWAYKHAQFSARVLNDPDLQKALANVDLRDWFTRFPWSRGNSPLSGVPEYEDYLFEQWENGTFGSYWKALGLYAKGYYDDFADVPMVHMTGWYDPYSKTAIENYVGLAPRKAGPVKLVLGPWTHGQRSVSYAGDVEFGDEATLDRNIAPDYISMRLAWFDRHLKNISSPDYLPKPVKIFVMGGGSGAKNADGRLIHGGHWRDFENWPVPEAQSISLYLTPRGRLQTAPSPDPHGSMSYVADPRNPVPTIGGAVTSGEPLMFAGAFDQRESAKAFGAKEPYRPLAERSDVLVFETDALLQDVEVIGPVEVRLFVSSDACDTDFTVKLLDVYPASPSWPDGFAMNISHGIIRMRYRQSYEQPEFMQANCIYEITIEAYPTANRFVAGHRIRLDISSSNFPHFDINPNSGEPESRATNMKAAHNTVRLSEKYPSRIVLPVVGMLPKIS